jgi:hypothetical protein
MSGLSAALGVKSTMTFPQTRRTLRQGRMRAVTTWVLIGGFLLQPVLAYLVTPFVEDDGKGHQIVVCTLNGQKVVNVDLPQLDDSQDTEHCSALKLYQMASTAQVSAPAVAPSVALYSIEWLDPTVDHQHRSLHFSAYSTRAPPVV